MRRRHILRIAVSALSLRLLRADTQQDVLNVIRRMAAGLSGEDPDAFMAPIDKSAPDRAALRDNVYALIAQNEVSCSVDLASLDQDHLDYVAQLDWSMQVRSRTMSGPIEQRQRTITVRLTRRDGKWRILSLAPISFFQTLQIR